MSEFSIGSIHGSRITDFTVDGIVIGSGGFSEVMGATSQLTGHRVAIKFIRNEKPENIKRVINEIHIHQQLMHPSIVSFYGRFKDDKYVYLVLELFEEDLERYLVNIKAQNLTMDTRRAKEITWQIVRGLEYLHGIGIIHRDLKPGNILLKDKGRTAKIGDFGLATASDNSASMERISRRNSTFCGTPDFMAPEMFVKSKDRTIDYSADVYSLGVVLYTMLTGSRPFNSNGKTISEIGEERHLSDIDFTRIKDSVAQDLVRRCMRQRGEGRRPSAKEILNHAWLAEIADEKARMMSELNISLDSGNGSDRSDTSHTSSSHSRSRISTLPPTGGAVDRVLGVITENSISGCNLTASSLNFSFLDNKRKPSMGSDMSRSSGCSGTSVHALQRIAAVNTEHLKAQRVKVGETVVCSILESGEVSVEFLRSHNGELLVTDVIRMRSGSSEVVEYEPVNNTTLTDAPPPVPSYRFQTFQLPNLPGKTRKAVLIASAFIDLVRSKTVKHWICTDKARSNLMRNEPLPNVESNFYDGIKIIHSDKKIQVKKDNQNIQTIFRGPPHSEFKPDLIDHWEHHVWCRNNLLEKDRQTRMLEEANPQIKIIALGYGRKPNTTGTSGPAASSITGRSSQDNYNMSVPPRPPTTPHLTVSSTPLRCMSPRKDNSVDKKDSKSSQNTRNFAPTQESNSTADRFFSGQPLATPLPKTHHFEDGMSVTVFNNGDFIKFQNAAGCHTWLRSEIPEHYDAYVAELHLKGHLPGS